MAISPRWQRYPTASLGPRLRAADDVLGGLLPALGLTVLFIFGLGFVAEEAGLDPWMERDRARVFAEVVDRTTRMTLGICLLLTLVGLGTSLVLAAAGRAATSKALVRAAVDGADRRVVPHFGQVGDVVTSPVASLRVLAWGLVVVGGLAGALLLVLVAVEQRGVAWLAGVAVVVASAWCAVLLWGPRLSRHHQARRDRISAHWTPADEEAAWAAMRAAAPDPENALARVDDERDPAAGRLRRVRRLRTASWILLTVFYGVLVVGIRARYPGSRKSELGPRADFGVVGERVVDGVVLGMLVLVSVVALLLLGGALLESSARRAQREWMQQLVRDPAAVAPTTKTLRYHAGVPGSPVASAIAVTGWILLSFGTAVVLLGVAEVGDFMEYYSGSKETFAALVVPGSLVVAVAVVMLVGAVVMQARAQAAAVPLCNELLARWPVLPRLPKDPKVTAQSHLLGPALGRGSGPGEPAD